MNAGTSAVCLVGKAHEFHVKTALGIPLDENIENISASFKHIIANDREALFDAEHFFDGFKANPDYALQAVLAAYHAGCRWVVLCDTNGGTLPDEIGEITKAVIAAGIPGENLGIHTHNDTENAVAGQFGGDHGGRAPSARHPEWSWRALRQCQPDHVDPDAVVKAAIGGSV